MFNTHPYISEHFPQSPQLTTYSSLGLPPACLYSKHFTSFFYSPFISLSLFLFSLLNKGCDPIIKWFDAYLFIFFQHPVLVKNDHCPYYCPFSHLTAFPFFLWQISYYGLIIFGLITGYYYNTTSNHRPYYCSFSLLMPLFYDCPCPSDSFN